MELPPSLCKKSRDCWYTPPPRFLGHKEFQGGNGEVCILDPPAAGIFYTPPPLLYAPPPPYKGIFRGGGGGGVQIWPPIRALSNQGLLQTKNLRFGAENESALVRDFLLISAHQVQLNAFRLTPSCSSLWFLQCPPRNRIFLQEIAFFGKEKSFLCRKVHFSVGKDIFCGETSGVAPRRNETA